MTTNDDPTRIGTGMSSNTKLLGKLDQWVGESLGELTPDLGVRPGTAITWSTGLTALPSESEIDPQWSPLVVLYLELALTEERTAWRVEMLPPFALTRGLVHATIGDMVGELRTRLTAFQELVGTPTGE